MLNADSRLNNLTIYHCSDVGILTPYFWKRHNKHNALYPPLSGGNWGELKGQILRNANLLQPGIERIYK